jgi:hypothetical protein
LGSNIISQGPDEVEEVEMSEEGEHWHAWSHVLEQRLPREAKSQGLHSGDARKQQFERDAHVKNEVLYAIASR